MATANQRELTHQLTTSSSGGYELVVSPLVLALFGYWLDSMLGWTPVLTIVLAVFGVAGAVASQYLRYRARMATETEATTSVLGEQAAQRAAAREAKATARADELARLEAELAVAEAAERNKPGEQVA